MLYLITYDLRNQTKDYASLYEAIKGLGPWWHYLQSTWIVKTSSSVSEVSSRIKNSMEDSDNLLVVDISNMVRNGWLPKKAWDWLRDHDAHQIGENTSNG